MRQKLSQWIPVLLLATVAKADAAATTTTEAATAERAAVNNIEIKSKKPSDNTPASDQM